MANNVRWYTHDHHGNPVNDRFVLTCPKVNIVDDFDAKMLKLMGRGICPACGKKLETEKEPFK